jgi:hypothetical protein
MEELEIVNGEKGAKDNMITKLNGFWSIVKAITNQAVGFVI